MDALAAIVSVVALGLVVGGLAWWYKFSPWAAFAAWIASWVIMQFVVPAAIKAQLDFENSYNGAEVVSNGLPFWFTPLKWLLLGPILAALLCGFVRPGPMENWFRGHYHEE